MRTKSPKFPLLVKAGSAVVKIYREKKASGTYYRVGYYLGGKRTWLHKATLEEAKTEAEAKAAQLSRGDVDVARLTGRDRLIYGRALEALRSLEIPLDVAALEFAEAKKTLKGVSLNAAARFYNLHHGGIRPKTVADAVKEMIVAKTEKGVSATYLSDLRYRLKGFTGAFHCNVSAIVPDDLRDFLLGLKLAPRGFNNTVVTISTFFAFAKDRGWMARDADPLAGIEKRTEKSVPVEIFTPAEMAAILTHCSDDLRPCIALAAFAGFRSEEILRLDWADLTRRPGYIEIAADKAKTAARRLVPTAANLARWLAVSDKKEGRVWQHSKAWFFESQRDAVRCINEAHADEKEWSPFAWKANALRHSFISYRLAEIQDVNRVALEAGNSPRMIFKHYRELCTPAEAATWFALVPDEPANVLTMQATR